MSKLEQRPWGFFTVLHDTPYCKVKEIFINPGQRLSYQYHTKRKEVWTCVGGTLTVIRQGHEFTLVDGDTIEIGLGVHHRAWNKGNIPAAFVEVQTGSYFGEDDIIRLEDDYDRTNNTTNQP